MIAHARRSLMCLLFVASGLLLLAVGIPVAAQQSSVPRKVLQRTAAEYPPLARSMALQGVVRVDALVAPDGSVKSVEIRGGHPVLAQAAVNTVRRWRWEPAAHDSHELIEVKFSPE